MEANSSETINGNGSPTVLFDTIQSEFPEFISEVCGAVTESKNDPLVSSSNDKQGSSKSNGEKKTCSGSGNGEDSIASCLKELETRTTESRKEVLANEQVFTFSNSFLIELVNSLKNILTSLYHTTSLTLEKDEDTETKRQGHTQIKEEIKRIDSVLNTLLNFININTPIAKTNTLCTILEEVLEANEKQLQDKNIKVLKRCEKDLPETFIHHEQVKFIFHSILQYAMFSMLPNESMGILMRSPDFHDALESKKGPPENEGGYVEVAIGFNGSRKLSSPLENLSKILRDQREATDLILILVEEILTKNRGRMMIETNGNRPNTLITLRFPIERRNVVYYAPLTF
jgi:hypothetical protein